MGANQSAVDTEEITVSEDDAPFTLELRLMRAKHILPYNSIKGLTDPYAVISVKRTGQSHTTPACKNTVEPMWYHSVTFNQITPEDSISVELWDESVFKDDERIGKSSFTVSDVLVASPDASELTSKMQKKLEIWHNLEHESGSYSIVAYKMKGEGHVSLETSAPPRAFVQFINKKYRPSMVEKIPFRKSAIAKIAKGVVGIASNVAGAIHPALEIDSTIKQQLRSHSTYTVKLSGIESAFGGKMQGYNKEYSAAKRIFEGKLSFTMKKALVVQHNYLYGKPVINSSVAELRKDFYLTNGHFIDGIDLGNLLSFGDRNGKNRVYTYVIIDDEFRFCESGAAFAKDIESKHAMHAAAQPEVVYAGEFHWQKNVSDNGNNVLVV